MERGGKKGGFKRRGAEEQRREDDRFSTLAETNMRMVLEQWCYLRSGFNSAPVLYSQTQKVYAIQQNRLSGYLQGFICSQ